MAAASAQLNTCDRGRGLIAQDVAGAVDLVERVERETRLAAVSAVDVMDELDRSRVFYDQGHANARIMYALSLIHI